MSTEDELDAEADDLRLAFAGALLGSHGMLACPPSEEVWDAFHGALPPERRARVVDHMAVCPMCAEAWRLAVRGTPGPLDERR